MEMMRPRPLIRRRRARLPHLISRSTPLCPTDMPVIREDTLASGLDERTKRNITIKLELEALLRHRQLPMLLEI